MTDKTFIRRHKDIQQRSGTSPRKMSPWTIWIYGLPAAAVLGGILHVNGIGPFQALEETLAKEAELKERVLEIQSENLVLQDQVDALKPGEFGIEKRAREQLGWSMPGEIVIHMPDKR